MTERTDQPIPSEGDDVPRDLAGAGAPSDATAGDAGRSDAAAGEARPSDAAVGDATVGDAGAGDAGAAEAGPAQAAATGADPSEPVPTDESAPLPTRAQLSGASPEGETAAGAPADWAGPAGTHGGGYGYPDAYGQYRGLPYAGSPYAGSAYAGSPYGTYAAGHDTAGYPAFGGYPPPPTAGAADGGAAGTWPTPGSDTTARATSAPRRTVLVAAAVAAVVGAGVGAGTVAIAEHDNRPASAGLQYSTEAAPAAKVDGTVTAAADKIRPSVVTIEVASGSERDTGSGVIIRPDGYILTNNHVVSNSGQGASTVVTLADGRRSAATVVGRDPSDDLAVIKVGLSGLKAATFASSSSLAVGQTVVAVGAPLGLSDTVTAGIVSSTARPVQTGDSQTTATFNAVQTDAAINPGNSGGPLVNLNGDVVGINAAIATDSSQGGLQVPGQSSQSGNIGIGFAIPSDEARRIASELISTGKATHAVMGVNVRDASEGASATAPVGARVQAVTAGGPAAKAGIKVGDVITKVDSQRIDGADAVVAAIRSHAPFQTVSITLDRGGATRAVTVRLDSATD